MGNEQSTMQASEVNAADSDQRRAYLMSFVHMMGGNYVEKVMIEHLFAEERACDRLNELGIVQIGTVYFEYQVDRATWINLFRRLRDQAPLWPFEGKSPARDDMSHGVSSAYKQWRINRNLPVETFEQDANMFSSPSVAGANTQQVPLDASLIAPGDICQRRAWLDGFIRQIGSDYAEHVGEKRRASERVVSQKLAVEGARQIGAGFFEYNVDKNAWREIFKRLGDQAPPWPWKDGPQRDDMIGGISLVYRQWRVDNNLPVDTNEGATN
ncbi:uncharacterized protein LW93_5121 [Fusarium fujikuroi]|nr:uncharacterized protein LW93_5121 [Fusarium fujikuroi]